MDLNELIPKEPVSKPDGWTKDDKYYLYVAIRTCGLKDISVMQSLLPNKSTEDIKQMIAYYKGKAMDHPSIIQNNKNKRIINSLSRVPLTLWAKFLTDSLNYSELQTETANALRLIAECEDIPKPATTCNIDFRLIYHIIADALDGKALINNPEINHILETCIVDTAYTSKSFILKSALRFILETLDLDAKDVTGFPRPTESHEVAILRHLATQKNYNPLNIPEGYLKPSVHQQAAAQDNSSNTK